METQPLVGEGDRTVYEVEGELQNGGVQPKRSVSVVYLGGMIFFLICGGPAGIEDAVRAAGPLPTLAAILIIPVVWALPQALMTAELSTMNSSNGGYIIWVSRAFGNFGGWMNAYNAVFSNMFDLSLYPVLFVDFVERLVPLSVFQRWMVYGVLIVFIVFLNVRSIEVVGVTSVVFTIVVLAPYVLESIMEVPEIKPERWMQVKPAETVNLTLFMNTILWNYSGWDSLGSIAGEVRNPQKTYPKGVLLGIVLTTATYFIPVAVGVSLSSTDWSLWEQGHLIRIASSVSKPLGEFMLFSSAVSALGAFNANMSTDARVLWCVADFKMLPKFFTVSRESSNAPVASVFFHAVTTAVLCMFPFEVLVEISTFINCIRLLFEFSAFLWLKYSEPNARRPFEVPYGLPGALLITFPKVLLVLFTMFVASRTTWILSIAFNVLVGIMYLFWESGSLVYISRHWCPASEAERMRQAATHYHDASKSH